jgi:hypothetical protein
MLLDLNYVGVYHSAPLNVLGSRSHFTGNRSLTLSDKRLSLPHIPPDEAEHISVLPQKASAPCGELALQSRIQHFRAAESRGNAAT